MKIPNTNACDSADAESTAVAERCEACGASFACGASLDGCWCSELKLSDSQLESMRGRYQRCLCRSCLEQLANSEIENIQATDEGREDGWKEK